MRTGTLAEQGSELMASPGEGAVNVGEQERWISMISGAALTIYGLTKKDVAGAALSLTGGYLFYRGQTGHCVIYESMGVNTNKSAQSTSIHKSIVINRSPEDVYRFWHNLENLPRFMDHLESVSVLSARRSHWTARTPGGIRFEWDAEMTEDIPNQKISWRSLPGSDVQNEGTVEFRRTYDNGTELTLNVGYAAPEGSIGPLASKMMDYISSRQLKKELQQFKNLVESETAMAA